MNVAEWPNQSHFSELLGLVLVHREDGAAIVSVRIEQRHANTNGIAHGGVLTSLMDTACGAAMAYQPSIGGNGVATVSLQVTYLGPSFLGDTITATSRRRGKGRTLVTLDVEAKNQKDELVAIGICTLRVRSSSAPLTADSKKR
jgi:acyl-CoA thioesterase